MPWEKVHGCRDVSLVDRLRLLVAETLMGGFFLLSLWRSRLRQSENLGATTVARREDPLENQVGCCRKGGWTKMWVFLTWGRRACS